MAAARVDSRRAPAESAQVERLSRGLGLGEHLLVDGQVAGTWRYDAGRVITDAFMPPPSGRATAQVAASALNPELKAHLDGISPTMHADDVHVPVYILHVMTDTAILVAHAALLAQALGDNVKRFTEFGRFGHGQPGTNGLTLDDAGDVVALALYLRDVVAAATE